MKRGKKPYLSMVSIELLHDIQIFIPFKNAMY